MYPILKNNLGGKARDHALEGHTELKKMLVKLDGMHLEHSDGSINRDYVNGFAELLKVRGWIREGWVLDVTSSLLTSLWPCLCNSAACCFCLRAGISAYYAWGDLGWISAVGWLG